jgi:hypothetical protein
LTLFFPPQLVEVGMATFRDKLSLQDLQRVSTASCKYRFLYYNLRAASVPLPQGKLIANILDKTVPYIGDDAAKKANVVSIFYANRDHHDYDPRPIAMRHQSQRIMTLACRCPMTKMFIYW